MKPFKFTLEKLLELRKFEEEQVRMELGKVRTLIETELEKKKNFEEEYKKAIKEMKEVQSQLSVNSAQQYFRYFTSLKSSMEKQDMIIQHWREYETKIIEKYKEAMKKRKILENLEEKKMQEYNYERKRKEKKEIEDLVLMHGNQDSSFHI